jgi:hypothetical protein
MLLAAFVWLLSLAGRTGMCMVFLGNLLIAHFAANSRPHSRPRGFPERDLEICVQAHGAWVHDNVVGGREVGNNSREIHLVDRIFALPYARVLETGGDHLKHQHQGMQHNSGDLVLTLTQSIPNLLRIARMVVGEIKASRMPVFYGMTDISSPSLGISRRRGLIGMRQSMLVAGGRWCWAMDCKQHADP